MPRRADRPGFQGMASRRVTAIAAQVASEVSAVVAASLQAARGGHHEYLNLAPTTTSTPTSSVADDAASSYVQPSTTVHARDLDRQPAACLMLSSDLASVLDASMMVATQRSASALAQQQHEEDAACHVPTSVGVDGQQTSGPGSHCAESKGVSVVVCLNYGSGW